MTRRNPQSLTKARPYTVKISYLQRQMTVIKHQSNMRTCSLLQKVRQLVWLMAKGLFVVIVT